MEEAKSAGGKCNRSYVLAYFLPLFIRVLFSSKHAKQVRMMRAASASQLHEQSDGVESVLVCSK